MYRVPLLRWVLEQFCGRGHDPEGQRALHHEIHWTVGDGRDTTRK